MDQINNLAHCSVGGGDGRGCDLFSLRFQKWAVCLLETVPRNKNIACIKNFRLWNFSQYGRLNRGWKVKRLVPGFLWLFCSLKLTSGNTLCYAWNRHLGILFKCLKIAKAHFHQLLEGPKQATSWCFSVICARRVADSTCAFTSNKSCPHFICWT